MRDQPAPFKIEVSEDVLSDLGYRLAKTWSFRRLEGMGWDAGTDPDYLEELVQYWGQTYEWRLHGATAQAILNLDSARMNC
jgi:hypothetical protein